MLDFLHIPPETAALLWNTLAALVTLAILSFLFGDNPIYKFTERLWVGISTGYWTMLLWHQGLNDKVVIPIFERGEWWYVFPVLLGILMWFRISPKLGYLSRYALGFYVGISAGVFIPVTFRASVFEQINGTIIPVEPSPAGISYVLALIGVVCSLVYFFFSKAHRGVLGVMSKAGIYTLMIGFGAGFGLTVMGRVALLVQRVLFMRDYFVSLFS